MSLSLVYHSQTQQPLSATTSATSYVICSTPASLQTCTDLRDVHINEQRRSSLCFGIGFNTNEYSCLQHNQMRPHAGDPLPASTITYFPHPDTVPKRCSDAGMHSQLARRIAHTVRTSQTELSSLGHLSLVLCKDGKCGIKRWRSGHVVDQA